MKNAVIKVSEQELYNQLVEECRGIITERVFRSRLEIILAHGEIGACITHNALYKKYGKQNKEFIERLAQGIGISYSEVSRSIQFWNKYHIDKSNSESWSKFKEGKNISWAGIKQYYLPNPQDKKEPLNPKYQLGQQVRVNFLGAIIAVKGDGAKPVYKVEFECGETKDDLWIPELLIEREGVSSV